MPARSRVPGLLRRDRAVGGRDGPEPQDHISAVFFLAFLLFSWTTASIMSGALIERVRLSAYLMLAVLLGSAVWIMDAAWGWSAGGWLTTKYGFHDSIASARRARRRGRVHARRPTQPRAANREVRPCTGARVPSGRTTRT